METSLENLTFSTILSRQSNNQLVNEYREHLKNNFENSDLWFRYALTLNLTEDGAKSAIQAFNECLRIDQHDPLPAMLAAKLLLEALDDPDDGLQLAKDAIERCQNGVNYRYKNIAPLLSKCYLLASIMNAHIYEREPESIKHLKTYNLEASLNYLDLANKTYPNDYLVHFHKALHEARQKPHTKQKYQSALESIDQAIKLNHHHVPSMQLKILLLSALKDYDEALDLCESTLHEFEDNLLLLYIKCNLEQCVADIRGYKPALNTAQHILKCVRKSDTSTNEESNQSAETKQTTNLFARDRSFRERQQGLYLDELSVWVLVAEIFIKIGSVADAELCVDESSIHANGALSHEIMFIRGLIAKAKNNLIEAKSFFQSCLALCPRHSIALQQMAHVHFLLGNHYTAEKFLNYSLDIDSDCYKTWHYLGLVFIEMNQHEKANECIKKATELEEFSPVIPITAISRLTLE